MLLKLRANRKHELLELRAHQKHVLLEVWAHQKHMLLELRAQQTAYFEPKVIILAIFIRITVKKVKLLNLKYYIHNFWLSCRRKIFYVIIPLSESEPTNSYTPLATLKFSHGWTSWTCVAFLIEQWSRSGCHSAKQNNKILRESRLFRREKNTKFPTENYLIRLNTDICLSLKLTPLQGGNSLPCKPPFLSIGFPVWLHRNDVVKTCFRGEHLQ